MMQPLSFEEFQQYAEQHHRIAVFQEFILDSLTPTNAYQQLTQLFGLGVIQENLRDEGQQFSYLCFDLENSLELDGGVEKPLESLRQFQTRHSYITRNTIAEKVHHTMGFFAYDSVRYFENIADRHPDDNGLPLVLMQFFRLALTFDHQNQIGVINLVITTSDNLTSDFQSAQEKIKTILNALFIKAKDEPTVTQLPEYKVDVSDVDFMQKVNKAKECIIAGDAFQIVLSRCFKQPISVPPFVIYQTLRDVSPVPFLFYYPTKNAIFLGASPERMVSVIQNKVTVNPIAGTRKRAPQITDDAIAADLLSDQKEIAEHMMLIDLARNDVGSVTNPGSVEIAELLKVKHYSHVTHITSTVTGELKDKHDAFDALSATFPAGTLSGAPKIRAMDIIDELENSKRGLYGGVLFRIDGLNQFESCIAIRFADIRNNIATIRVGAGIVYDSNPASEAEETRQKAQAMLHAIARAHGESL